MANLGVCTDKLVVLDIDPRHGGDESFAALEREYGQLPLTWRALTGGGGEHIIFACPDGVVIKNVAAPQMEPHRSAPASMCAATAATSSPHHHGTCRDVPTPGASTTIHPRR
jgi:Bifunctional DNA primase/polymerase, N-terminal